MIAFGDADRFRSMLCGSFADPHAGDCHRLSWGDPLACPRTNRKAMPFITRTPLGQAFRLEVNARIELQNKGFLAQDRSQQPPADAPLGAHERDRAGIRVQPQPKGDKVPPKAVESATTCDTQRQNLGLRADGKGGDSVREDPVYFPGVSSKLTIINGLVANATCHTGATIASVCVDLSKAMGRKSPCGDDKKRQLQNWQIRGSAGTEDSNFASIRRATWLVGNPRPQFEPTNISGIYSRQLRSSGPSGK